MFTILSTKQRTNIRPVFVMCEEGVSSPQLGAVIKGIREVLEIGDIEREVEVRSLGIWRDLGYHKETVLVAWKSVDWYVDDARRATPHQTGQINGDRFITLLLNEPWQELEPHYDVVVLRSDLWAEGTNFVIGLAVKGYATVISVNRFQALPMKEQLDCITTEAAHEVGHVFGLVSDERTENVEMSLGKHCTNRCTMRQGLNVPTDWQAITRDRLRHGMFCAQCEKDLKGFWR